ncbi:MAG TPA: YdcF family protein [Fulvivirga sp.]|nr:YdcF family protein [Fulvivirga sp.]
MIKRFLTNVWVKWILILHGVVILCFVILFFYIRHLTVSTFQEASQNKPYDAIIVPGYPFSDSTWHNITKTRVYWSKYLYDNGYTKNIIFSGSAVYTPYIESVIMKIYGEAIGLPSDHLYSETKAEHSTENLYYSLQLAKQMGFTKIALATDPLQSFFLMGFARNQDYKIDYLPIQYKILDKLNLISPNIDPSSAFVDNFVSLPDRQGYFERFNGTLGNHIKDTTD